MGGGGGEGRFTAPPPEEERGWINYARTQLSVALMGGNNLFIYFDNLFISLIELKNIKNIH